MALPSARREADASGTFLARPKLAEPVGSRSPALVLALLVAAVPLAGCMDLFTSAEDGYGENWPLKLVQADLLHDRGLSGAGVTVAIIDTGIDLSHPEFEGVQVRWADLVNDRTEAYDDNGHGTHVAGIIAAQGVFGTLFSGFRLKGVAPGVDLIVIKAIDATGKGDESRVARGVNSAVSSGADIIVLSLGGGSRPVLGTSTEDAVKRAVAKGVYVVAAAGNKEPDESSCTVSSPASVEGVIAVGAVDRDERIGDFSCRGSGTEGSGSIVPGIPNPVGESRDPHKKPEVVAPGVDVLSAWKDEGYASARGTSQAAPMVGGLLALLLEAEPRLKGSSQATVYEVKEKLVTTSKKVGPLAGKGASAHDAAYGYGLVQGQRLLDSL